MKAGAMNGPVASLAALLLTAASSAPIAAQEFPSRPVRAITALVPGGLSDVFMRVAGEEFQKQLGQPIVVENRPGGGLNIGGGARGGAAPPIPAGAPAPKRRPTATPSASCRSRR